MQVFRIFPSVLSLLTLGAFALLTAHPVRAELRTLAREGGPHFGTALLFQNSLTPSQEVRHAADSPRKEHWEEFWSQLWRSNDPEARIRELGGNTSLIRLSWRDLEPEPGRMEPSRLSALRQLLQNLRSIQPGHRLVLSLSSGDEPLWFIDRGGWLSPESPRLFFEYARHLFEAVGDLSQDWLLLEEPMSRALGPLLTADPETPPETLLADAFEIAFQLARAHRIVASYIKLKQSRTPEGIIPTVGVAIRAHHYVAGPRVSADPLLLPRVSEISHLAHWAWIQGLLTGNLEFKLSVVRPSPRTLELQRVLPKSDLPPWDSGPLVDWVGLNLGTRLELSPSERGDLGLEIRWPEGIPQDDQGWPMTPEDHAEILRDAEKQTSLPLWITQSGIVDAQGASQLDFLRRQWATLAPFLTPHGRVHAYFFRTLYGTPETKGLVGCEIPLLPNRDTLLSCAPEKSFTFLQDAFRSLGI